MPCLSQSPERYLHSPRLQPSPDGTATLFAIAWQGSGECVVRWPVAADGTLGDEQLGPARPAIVSLTRGEQVRESDDTLAELEETRDGCRVWVEHADGIASVWLSRMEGGPVSARAPEGGPVSARAPEGGPVSARAPEGALRLLVFRARGSVLSPSLALARDGVWFAFHHDVREDTSSSDVSQVDRAALRGWRGQRARARARHARARRARGRAWSSRSSSLRCWSVTTERWRCSAAARTTSGGRICAPRASRRAAR